jgi:hypothetical protein
LDTELPDLNVVVDDLQDYGVYAHDVDVAFDGDELFGSDDADEHVSQRNREKILQPRRGKAYMKHCLEEVPVEN